MGEILITKCDAANTDGITCLDDTTINDNIKNAMVSLFIMNPYFESDDFVQPIRY